VRSRAMKFRVTLDKTGRIVIPKQCTVPASSRKPRRSSSERESVTSFLAHASCGL
jgi:hypothetical protein